MSGPYQGRDLSNCGVGRLRVAINCGVLSVKHKIWFETTHFKANNFDGLIEGISTIPKSFQLRELVI